MNIMGRRRRKRSDSQASSSRLTKSSNLNGDVQRSIESIFEDHFKGWS